MWSDPLLIQSTVSQYLTSAGSPPKAMMITLKEMITSSVFNRVFSVQGHATISVINRLLNNKITASKDMSWYVHKMFYVVTVIDHIYVNNVNGFRLLAGLNTIGILYTSLIIQLLVILKPSNVRCQNLCLGLAHIFS